MTTARLLYRSHLFIAGLTLIVLGLGNYLAAQSKVAHYQEVIAEIAPQIPAAPPFLLREEGRPFPSEAWERWEIASAKEIRSGTLFVSQVNPEYTIASRIDSSLQIEGNDGIAGLLLRIAVAVPGGDIHDAAFCVDRGCAPPWS